MFGLLDHVSRERRGGAWSAQLARLREYHREHGNLGKRYVEVIQTFNPKYAPKMVEDKEMSLLHA